MSATKTLERPAGAETAYDVDFYAWALAQADVLRSGRPAELDVPNLAEEIESLGKEQFSKIRSAFRIILLHMLKWDQQPERRSRSWLVSVSEQRDRLDDVLSDSPSLKRRQTEALARAYRRARLKAADETGLPMARFPVDCPYSLDEVLTRKFEWPED